jgi:TP901 family phage tail tape measure protein
MSGRTETVTIKANFQVDTATIAKAAKELQNFISGSNVSENQKKEAVRMLKVVEEYTRKIDLITRKTSINKNDIDQLRSFASIIEGNFTALNNFTQQSGAVATAQMKQLKTDIQELNSVASKQISDLKTTFSKATGGETFDKAKATADGLERAAVLEEIQRNTAIELAAKEAENQINIKNQAQSVIIAQERATQQAVIDEYNKNYGTQINDYKEFLQEKDRLSKLETDQKEKYGLKENRIAQAKLAVETKSIQDIKKLQDALKKRSNDDKDSAVQAVGVPGIDDRAKAKAYLEETKKAGFDANKVYEKYATEQISRYTTELELTKKINAEIKTKADLMTKSINSSAKAQKAMITGAAVDETINKAIQDEAMKFQPKIDKKRNDAKNITTEAAKTAADIASTNTALAKNIDLKDKQYLVEEKLNNDNYDQTLRETTAAAQAGTTAQGQLANEAKRAGDAFEKAAVKNKIFGEAVSGIAGQIVQATSAIVLMRKAWQFIEKGITTVKELDRQITQIGIVTNTMGKQIWNTFENFNRAAMELSSTTAQFLEGAKIFYQQGMDTSQVMDMVAATTMAAALSEVTFTAASETLTAAINAYSMEASQAMAITDKLAAVGAASAADFQELSVSMEKVAASASASGISFDSLLGILAKGVETTREAPEAIGTALKSVIARFQEMKVDPMADLGEGVNANRVEKALKTIDVPLRDVNGEFRDLDDVFADLGMKWEGLTRNQRAYIATMAAGSRQQSRFMAIMNNYDRTLQLIRTSTNSAGEALRQYAVYEDSVEASQNRLTNATELFYTQISSSDAIKSFYNIMTELMGVMSSIGPVATALGVGVSALGVSYLFSTSAVYKENIALAINTGLKQNDLKGIPKFITMMVQKIFYRNLETTAVISATAAQTAYNIVAFAGIAIIAGIVLGIGAYLAAEKKRANVVHENAAAMAKQADQETQSAINLKGLTDRYIELDKKLIRTNEEQAEYIDLIKQISLIAPELVAGIDAEGNAILVRNEILKESVKEYAKNARAATNAAAQARLASMEQAKWNATMEKGAPGQKTVDASVQIQQMIDSLKDATKTEKGVDTTYTYANGEQGTLKGQDFTRGMPKDFFGGQSGAKNIQKELEKAIADNVDPDKLMDVAMKRLKTGEEKWGALWFTTLGPFVGDHTFNNAQEELVKEQVTKIANTYSHYLKINLAETKNEVASLLNTIGQNNISDLEDAYGTVSNEYKDIVSSLTKTATDMSIANVEGIQAQADAIREDAPGIYNALAADLEKFREKAGFDKSLGDITKSMANGASVSEIKKSLSDLFTKFGVEDINIQDSITDSFFNEKEFNNQVQKVKDLIPRQFDEFGMDLQNTTKDTLQTVFANLPKNLTDILFNTIDSIDNEALAAQYAEMIGNVFSDTAFSNDFAKKIAEVDKTDNQAVQNLTDSLTAKIMSSGKVSLDTAKQLSETTMQAQLFPIGQFLAIAKTAYTELTKLNDLQKKSLTGAITLSDALDLADKGKVQAVTTLPTGELSISGSYLEAERLKTEATLTANLNKEIGDLELQKKALGAQDLSAINDINRQIDAYKKLVTQIKTVTLEERARIDNQDFLSGVSGINSTIESLKTYGGVFQKLNDGGMSYLDTIDAIGNDPTLLTALDTTNGKFELSKEKILEIADAKKQETITYLEGERTKLKAVSALLDYQATGTIDQKNLDIKLAVDTLNGYQSEVQGVSSVNDAQSESTKAYILNKQKEIDIDYEQYMAKMDQIDDEDRKRGIQGPPVPRVAKVVLDTTDLFSTETDINFDFIADSLAKKFQIGDVGTDAILAAAKKKIDAQIKVYDSAISGLQNVTLADMLDPKAKEVQEGFNKIFGEFDQFYNYLKKIQALENEMSQIDTKIGLSSTGGKEDIELLKTKMGLLRSQVDTTEQLIDRQEQSLTLARSEMSSKFGGFLSFSGKELEVRWDLINAITITSDVEKIWYDEMIASIDAYDQTYDSITANDQALLDYTKTIEDATKTLTDELVGTRQEIYDALVEADQREVDLAEKKFNKMKEIEDAYLKSVKTAIDKERQMRNDAQKINGLMTKKRKLAVLERDTSGVSSREAQTLRDEIATDEQSQRDLQVDRQYEALQEQTTLQQEQRDRQIQQLNEMIAFRQENKLYWGQVDALIAAGPAATAAALLNSAAFIDADNLAQTQLAKDIASNVGKLDTIYTLGLPLISSSVVGALNGGITTAINGTTGASNNVKSSVETFQAAVLPATQAAANAAAAARDQLIAANAKLDTANTALKDIYYKPTAGASNTSYYNTSNQTYYSTLIQAGGQSQTYDMENAYANWYSQYGGSWTAWLNYRKTNYGYKEGGVVDFTGPTMVHGSSTKPESFLNADQTALFAGLRDVLEGLNINNLGSSRSSGSNVSVGDINISLANKPNGSMSDLGQEFEKKLMSVLSGRINPAITGVRS